MLSFKTPRNDRLSSMYRTRSTGRFTFDRVLHPVALPAPCYIGLLRPQGFAAYSTWFPPYPVFSKFL